jgi:hypothetical protein
MGECLVIAYRSTISPFSFSMLAKVSRKRSASESRGFARGLVGTIEQFNYCFVAR